LKTLHLYLTRQVLATLVMTVTVFTFVLLLGNVLKEVLALLVNGQATLGLVIEAIVLLIPFVLMFALPMGMLAATLLVFGRFSADQELTAVRASGVSLVALVTPVLLLSVVASCLAALINMQVAPQCRIAYKKLFFRAGLERASSLIVEDRFMDDFPGYVVYVGRKDGTNLEEVLIYELDAEGKMQGRIHAARAKILSDVASREVRLQLFGVHVYDLVNFRSAASLEETSKTFQYNPPAEPKLNIGLSHMTFLQLREKLRELEQITVRSPPTQRLSAEQLREQKRQLEALKDDLTMPVRVQIHRQIAFSFASIAFTLIGIPLGIRAHRRETSVGIAMALILVLVYYSFIFMGQSLETRPELAPHLILWLPNFIFQAVGAVLLWRVNRGL
jgi:lipopolysaccharide export LptBFGC system permease protein LptF